MKHLPLDDLEIVLRHQFANRALLQQALTHSTYALESPEPTGDNEQLEFLGDAVLQLAASQELFQRFPSYQEGELSRLRAHLVNATHLARCATELHLGDYLRLGHGESKHGGRLKPAVLSDALEAVLAALYLDGGFSVARAFIVSHILEPELVRLSGAQGVVLLEADDRSRLQAMLHASGRPEPRYEMVREEGPAHCKSFTMQVIVLTPENTTEFAAEGRGNTKKVASRLAAQKALERLQSSSNG